MNENENTTHTGPGIHKSVRPTNNDRPPKRCVTCGAILRLVYETEHDIERGYFQLWVWLCPECGTEHSEGVI